MSAGARTLAGAAVAPRGSAPTVARPRLLDLFCGGGGAAWGYDLAGFDVVGVDIVPQPGYPFTFHQGDAMSWPLAGFDVVHGSPPCQDWSSMARATGRLTGTGWMLAALLERLEAWGGPYVVENVPGAPVPANLLLCGESFGLEVVRHRLFATKPFLLGPQCCHTRGGTTTGQYVAFRDGQPSAGRTRPPRAGGRTFADALGVPWMTARLARQAVPPAYTEWIGRRILEALATGEQLQLGAPLV